VVKQGSSVSSVVQISIDPKDYEKYLRLAYKDAKFAKPRNALGFTKDLPVEDAYPLLLRALDEQAASDPSGAAPASDPKLAQKRKALIEEYLRLFPKGRYRDAFEKARDP